MMFLALSLGRISNGPLQVGDCVRRESSPDPKRGTITAVIPNGHGLELFDEYEVDFGVAGILIAYDTQLKAT